MNWIETYLPQLTGVVVVLVVLWGRNRLLPAAGQSAVALWVAFGVSVVCGLVLGYSLADVASWVTGLGGAFGGVVASVSAIAAAVAGWHAVKMLIALVRDLA